MVPPCAGRGTPLDSLASWRDASLMNDRQMRKKLQELASKAYEEELRRALLPLAEAFERWKAGAVSSFQLSDLIHEFHQGPSHKIWSWYARFKPNATVPRAIAIGLLPRESLPEELAASLAHRIEAFTAEEDDQS